jgi:hypothetical protein
MSNEQRTAIYAAFAAVLTALGAFGIINADEQASYAEAGAELLGGLASLMAAVKTWRQRGESALITFRVDGTNAENVEAFTEALKRLRGSV